MSVLILCDTSLVGFFPFVDFFEVFEVAGTGILVGVWTLDNRSAMELMSNGGIIPASQFSRR
jgi:hypothetical protein